jgi:hypothetical protein
MSEADTTRLTAAEVNWGRDPKAVLWVGNRAVHQYWALLAPYFRDVLLVPHRRSEDETTAWSWRENSDGRAPTSTELTALRKRLANDLRAFTDNANDSAIDGVGVAKAANQSSVAELAAAMDGWGSRLVGMPDGELVKFVARTDSGLRLHSWGLMTAAVPFYPDERKAGKEDSAGDSDDRVKTGATAAPRKRRRRRWILLLILLAGTGVGGTTAWQVWSSVEHREDSSAGGSKREAGRFSLAKLWTRLAGGSKGSREASHASSVGSTAGLAGSENSHKASGSRGTASGDMSPKKNEGPKAGEDSTSFQAEPASGLPAQGRGLAAGAAAATPSAPAGAGSSAVGSGGKATPGAGSGASAGGGASPAGSTPTSAADSPQQQNSVEPKTPRPRASTAAAEPELDGHDGSRNPRPGKSESSSDQKAPAEPEPEPGESKGEAKPVGAEDRRMASARDPDASPPEPVRDENRTAEEEQESRGMDRLRNADKSTTTTDSPRDELPQSDSPPSKHVLSVSLETATASVPIEVNMAWASVVAVNDGKWQVRLLGEMILPTQPMRTGAGDTIEAMRAKARIERQALLPAAFSVVRGRQGYAVETAAENLRWRLPAGAEAVVTRTTTGRAEISWPEGVHPPEGIYEAVNGHGQPVMRMEVERADGLVVSLAENVRGWLYLEIDGDVAAFTGRRFSETTMPAGWKWSFGERGGRLEIPLAAMAGTSVAETVALSDAATGWSLVKRITLTATASAR